MPNYNHGHYIAEALEAIVQQSFRPSEVIIIDDASTDDSVKIIETFTRRHPFVRLLRNAQNRGVSFSCDLGINQSTGDYVFLNSADDQIMPGLFEKSMDLLARHPGAGMCSALGMMLGERGEDLGPYHTPVISRTERFITPDEFEDLYIKVGLWIVTYSAIYRRGPLIEAGGFRPELGYSPDGALNMLIPRRYGACFLPERLVRWRKSDKGHGLSPMASLEKAIGIMEEYETIFTRSGLFSRRLLATWKRGNLNNTIYESNRLNPGCNDDIIALCRRMPDPGLADRALAAFLESPLGLASLATKLYLFSQHPPRERLRIAWRKLRS